VTLAHNTSHVADGLDTLVYDLRKPKLQALASSYLLEVQQLEDAFWDLYLRSMIANGFGAALDQLGALVTQPRENRSDDVYRVWILARALVLRSSGRPPELARIARMILPQSVRVVVVEEYPAAFTLRLEGVLDASIGRALAALLQLAKANGVRLLVTYQPGTPFRYAASGASEFGSINGYGAGGYAALG
jgi:glycine/D-amino acid oxidase-like deaminating enzyme